MGRWQRTLSRLRNFIRGGDTAAAFLPGTPAALTGLQAALEVEHRAGSTIAHGHDPRAALSAATGLALGGMRASAILAHTDLMGTADLLAIAAGRQAPLVVCAGLRAASSHAIPLGCGHEGWHAVSDSGCILLMASSVQAAADLTLLARRLAEEVLIPVVVGMDSPDVADALQDVRLPSGEQVLAFLGSARDRIECPTPAQGQLFGSHRRRVPRWADPDAPTLLGPTQGPEAFALAAASRHAYVASHAAAHLARIAAELQAITGRPCGALDVQGANEASTIIVAQGSAIETARAVSKHLRGQRQSVSVVGITALRPLSAELGARLSRADLVLILDRAPMSLGASPLLRELSAALLTAPKIPQVRTLLYGAGGAALRAADLLLAIETGPQLPATCFLGAQLAQVDDSRPHRKAAAEALRQHYPNLDSFTLRAHTAPVRLLGPGAVSVAIHRTSGGADAALLEQAGALLFALDSNEGCLRTRPDPLTDGYDLPVVDRLLLGGTDLGWPGDDYAIDVAVVTGSMPHPLARPNANLAPNGVVLLAHASVRNRLPNATAVMMPPAGDHPHMRVLGALCRLVLERRGAEPALRKVTTTLGKLFPELNDAELAAFGAGWDGVSVVDATEAAVEIPEPPIPAAVRALGDAADGPGNLPRFWQQIGAAYGHGETDQLSGDPLLAAACVPPLTATLRRVSESRSLLPEVDTAKCTGCGDCWNACPDAAIRTAAVTPTALLRVATSAPNAGGLRPLSGKLATLATRAFAKSNPTPGTAEALLRVAFDKAITGLSGDRLTNAQTGLEAALGCIGALPLVRSQALFGQAEANAAGSGALLSLVVDPDTCKGCSACVAACGEDAIVAVGPDPQRVARNRVARAAIEQLPAPSPDSLARAHNDMGQAAALQLVRDRALVLSGADDASPGSGEKLALRLCLAAAEEAGRVAMAQRGTELEQLASELETAVRERLTRSAPGLDALSRGLAAEATDDDWSRAKLTASVETAGGSQAAPIAVVELQKIVALALQIRELKQRLTTGDTGQQGRARALVVVAAGLAARWIGAFPHNPFRAPVVVDPAGCATPLSQGLVEALVDRACQEATLWRQAKAALDPRAAEPEIPTHFSDLSEAERVLCPPLLLVVGPGADETLSHLRDVLYSGLPIKVLVLTDRLANAEETHSEWADVGLAALGQGPAFVLQSTVASPDHLVAGALEAIRYGGPALLHVFAPVPGRAGKSADSARQTALDAVAQRRFPLFRFDPRADGVLGACLDLSGNPEDPPNDDAPRVWRMLQEVAGLESPAAERIKAQATAQAGRERDAAIAEREAQWEQLAIERVTAGLLELAQSGGKA